jgi:hypothetical protein
MLSAKKNHYCSNLTPLSPWKTILLESEAIPARQNHFCWEFSVAIPWQTLYWWNLNAVFRILIQAGQNWPPEQEIKEILNILCSKSTVWTRLIKTNFLIINFFYTNFVTNLGLDADPNWIRIQQQAGSGTGFSEYGSETLLLRLFGLCQQGSMQRIRNVPSYQYCGSGSVGSLCFWASWIRIGMDPDPSNIKQK